LYRAAFDSAARLVDPLDRQLVPHVLRHAHNAPRPLIEVPVGITLTTEDVDYPRELADRSYSDIRFWHDATAGGHFLPLEEPELVATDLREFFRPLRDV
jgi:pimeloyl-ACP methyl ester carboxylesterase